MVPALSVKPARRAFSLIEVTLSLAIVAVALLSIMALMPVGLKMMSDSSQGEVMANIITELRGQFQQLPFSPPLVSTSTGDSTTVTTMAAQILYYDVQGNSTTALSTTGYYKATFSITPLQNIASGDASKTTNYVNGDKVGMYSNNAVAITVVLNYPFKLPAAAQKFQTNVIFVAKQVGQ